MHEAVDLPRLTSVAICLEHSFHPWILATLIFSEFEELVYWILYHPKHLQDLLFTCEETWAKGIGEESFVSNR